MPATLLLWDSEFFGFRIARAGQDRLTPPYLEELDSWCHAQGIRCLYFLAASDHPATPPLAQQAGFLPVDVRLTLERRLSRRLRPPQPQRGVVLRPATPDDLPALLAIAADAYTQSRFYFDPGFPRPACSRLYQTWIEKSFHGYADIVLVAEAHSEPVGYVTCSLAPQSASGTIDLTGVAPAARGQGIGETLVRHALAWLAENGARRVEVVTQGRNIAAQRLYQRAGFVAKDLHLWYHKWYELPDSLQ
ncbi:MAG: GNAT family N-acetyltransferase [Chloroflexi bacterium]|nr:GNAT family N-acetyltransferase [Chloroflexota bacterium]